MKTKLKLIRDAFDALAFLNHECWTAYRDQLFNLCNQEERQHRGSDFQQYHTDDSASASDCAKMFAVHRIAEYLTEGADHFPKGRDYLHTQTSCFQAAGLVDEFGEKIRAAWKEFDIQELARLNYTDLVKVKKEVAA